MTTARTDRTLLGCESRFGALAGHSWQSPLHLVPIAICDLGTELSGLRERHVVGHANDEVELAIEMRVLVRVTGLRVVDFLLPRRILKIRCVAHRREVRQVGQNLARIIDCPPMIWWMFVVSGGVDRQFRTAAGRERPRHRQLQQRVEGVVTAIRLPAREGGRIDALSISGPRFSALLSRHCRWRGKQDLPHLFDGDQFGACTVVQSTTE